MPASDASSSNAAPLSVRCIRNDQFALTLAKTTEESILLTGDKALKKASTSLAVEARGLLWLCDEM